MNFYYHFIIWVILDSFVGIFIYISTVKVCISCSQTAWTPQVQYEWIVHHDLRRKMWANTTVCYFLFILKFFFISVSPGRIMVTTLRLDSVIKAASMKSLTVLRSVWKHSSRFTDIPIENKRDKLLFVLLFKLSFQLLCWYDGIYPFTFSGLYFTQELQQAGVNGWHYATLYLFRAYFTKHFTSHNHVGILRLNDRSF